MDVKSALADNVKSYRNRLGLSQEDLADAAGLHRTYISGIERGIRNPSISIVAKLATALGVEPADLLSGKGAGA